jgi:transcriptional regulator with XRE-family HTH domain
LKKARSTSAKMDEEAKEDRTALQAGNLDADDKAGKVGKRIRMFREMQGWSLTDASKATGIPTATLSRIENSKMSPTFGLLLRLMTGMKVGWLDLVGGGAQEALEEQISFGYPADAKTFQLEGSSSSYVLPHMDAKLSEILHSVIFEVGAHSAEEAGGLSAHNGIEFCYVLSGTVMLHIAGREPQELRTGCTALFNSSLPHGYLVKPGKRARVLNVTVRDPLMSESTLPFVHGRVAKSAPGGSESD